ncbi:MAG: hypothetical protein IKR18_11025, partial [Bacteroidaceae bacterium]|nr:hypothetical protein [Bacteroidaceae bacterium]
RAPVLIAARSMSSGAFFFFPFLCRFNNYAYLCIVHFDAHTFYLLKSLIRTSTSKRELRANQVHIGVAPIKCRLLHSVFEVVLDLDESMAGLHFSYAPKFLLNVSDKVERVLALANGRESFSTNQF